MKKESWLLTANSSFARIFKIGSRHQLTELKTLEHPESRLHNIDLVSDKPGRDFESGGTRRHALEPKNMPKKLEFVEFAKMIADELQQGHQQNTYDSLYIAASPSLLGLLRKELNANVTKLIKGEVDKDLAHMKTEEILQHLPFFS